MNKNYSSNAKNTTQKVSITQVNDNQSTSPLFTNTYIQGIMREALGYYVVCEFLIGTEQIVERKGYLSSVGINYFILYDVEQNVFTLCDIYSVKFVNFTEYKNEEYIRQPGYEPGTNPNNSTTNPTGMSFRFS